MLNSEPQTYVITSETLLMFLLLPDLSKVSDVRTLLSLKKWPLLKKAFEKSKRAKRAAQFFQRVPLVPPPSYATAISLL